MPKMKDGECFEYGTWVTGPYWSVLVAGKKTIYKIYKEMTGFDSPEHFQRALTEDCRDRAEREVPHIPYWKAVSPKHYTWRST